MSGALEAQVTYKRVGKMSKMTERIVSDFKNTEDHGNGADNSKASRNLINDIQEDRERFGSSASWKRELKDINQKLHDQGVLPRVSLENGQQEMKIMMLTSEKGLSKGVVLTSGEGNQRKNVILNDQGKYFDAEKTDRGWVAKPNGTEYEKASDGVLKIKEKPGHERETEERKRNIDTIKKTDAPDPAGPEKRMTEEDRAKKASELLDMVRAGDDLRASKILEGFDTKDATAVAKQMMHLSEGSDTQLRFKIQKDAFGQAHLTVRDARVQDKEDNAAADAREAKEAAARTIKPNNHGVGKDGDAIVGPFVISGDNRTET
jgi:hypothetical protein